MDDMKTSFEMLIQHMQEWLKASKIRSTLWLRDNMDDADIIKDAYIYALTNNAESSVQVRKYYDDLDVSEAQARCRVATFMRDFTRNLSKVLRGRLRLIKENGDLIIENTHSKPQNVVAMMNNIFGLRLADEDKILVCWKMDIISTEDAMKKIDCSRQTLYNKWTPLAQALKEMI
jgi:hypothetical protein